MNEGDVNNYTIKWHYTITLNNQSKKWKMNESKSGTINNYNTNKKYNNMYH